MWIGSNTGQLDLHSLVSLENENDGGNNEIEYSHYQPLHYNAFLFNFFHRSWTEQSP